MAASWLRYFHLSANYTQDIDVRPLAKLGMFLSGCRKWNRCVKVFDGGVMPFICFPAIPWKGLIEERGKQSGV